MVDALELLPRNPQDPTISYSIITNPGGDLSTTYSALITASAPPTVFTTVTQPFVVTYTNAQGTSIQTTQRTLTVTDAAQYSSILSNASSKSTFSTAPTASASASKTASTATASPSAAAASTNKMGILIPAIVAPIVAIFIIAFVLFWWFMRRRAQKAARDEPEFVMQQRGEKSHVRNDSAHSQSSTRKLVSRADSAPMKKEVTSSVAEVGPTSLDLFPGGRVRSSGLGFDATKFSSGANTHSRQISNSSHNPSGPPLVSSVAVRNFSRGPSRPSTATKENESNNSQFSQNRSLSSPIPKPLNIANGAQKKLPSVAPILSSQNGTADLRVPPKNPNRRPGVNGGRSPPRSGDPSPDRRPAPGPPPKNAPPKDRSIHQQSQPRNGDPSPAPIQTGGRYSTRHNINPTGTAGAHNVSSPTSQYSPLPKDQVTPPKLADGKTPRKSPPSAIKTGNSPLTQSSADFSEENMRIARLADSSRLGFYPTKSSSTTTTTTIVTPPANTLEPPSPSPRLPPPATRDVPPSAMNIPIPPPPAEPVLPASNSRRADSFAPDRKSVRSLVSRLSSDDGYVDMELDAKSDVSSLDERERWQVEQNSRSESRGGLGGYGAVAPLRHPPPLVKRQGTDSDASGSMYSLGKY